MDLRLEGTFTLRAPLSHIGENISTTSYLAEEPIVQPSGEVALVFAYSGNALRGMWRDAAAAYLLDALGGPLLPLDTFHLLFSGGAIGGEQVVDVERARAYRRALPLLALWGGGVGNQILPGKLRCGIAYPVCRETAHLLNPALREEAAQVSYRALTFERSYSRMDDARDERKRAYLALAAPAETQGALLDESTKPRRAQEPPQQMRYTAELLAPGTRLATAITLLDVSEVELGCLVSAIHRWARAPYLGGKSGSGHGLCDLLYTLIDLDSSAEMPFLTVDDTRVRLRPPAQQAKDAYDAHCRALYDAYLAEQQPELTRLLAGAR